MEDQKKEDNLQNDATPAPADPATAGTGAATPGDELLKTQQERDEYLAMLKRERADFINFRKRAEEEKRESIMFGQGLLLSKWLPLIENLERALEHLPADLSENDWVKGVVQIKNLFDQELSRVAVSRIVSVGQPFDSTRHEAMMEMPGDKGIVVAEFETGYTFQGKVIKPAKVGVGSGTESDKLKTKNQKSEKGAPEEQTEKSGQEEAGKGKGSQSTVDSSPQEEGAKKEGSEKETPGTEENNPSPNKP